MDSSATSVPARLEVWQRANLLWSDESGRFHQEKGPWLYALGKLHQSHFTYQLETRLWIQEGHNNYGISDLLWKDGENYKYIMTGELYEWLRIPSASVPAEVCRVLWLEWTVDKPSKSLLRSYLQAICC